MKTLLKQITYGIIALVSILTSCAVIYNIPETSDYKKFPFRTIHHDPESVFHFKYADNLKSVGNYILTNNHRLLPNVVTLDEYLSESKTSAFLIIRNDTILYEKYCRKYSESSIFNTFSVTKVFVTSLIGIALSEGLIDSLNQPVTDYIPELLKTEGFNKVTIRHLLTHTSGIKFSNVMYNPLSDNAKYYYGHNLRKLALNSKLDSRPGEKVNYGSSNVQLLAMVLERATGMPVTSYLQEKIWQKIGMEYDATWSLDNRRKDAIEKGFSCINCTAIDLAKFGRLYLNEGGYNNQQVIPKDFLAEAVCRDTTGGSCWNFQYNFRLGPKLYKSYYARGLYGQLIYIYPAKNIVIIRLGEADLKYNPQFINHIVIQIIDQL